MYPGLSAYFVFSWLHGIDMMHDVAQLRVDGGTFRFVFSWLHGIDMMHNVAQLRVDGGTFFLHGFTGFHDSLHCQLRVDGGTFFVGICGLKY